MNTLKTTLLATLLAAALPCAATPIPASSSIIYSVRSITNSSFTDYSAGWAAQTSPVNTSTLSTFAGAYGGNNSYDFLQVDFSVAATRAGSSFAFELAPDAGHGGALYIDGQLLAVKHNDLWWGGNWNNSSQLLSATLSNLSSGNHVIQAYWAEDCCNGAQGAMFSVGNGAWETLSVSNLNALAVPEPTTLALLGIGFAGLGWRKRKTR